MPNLLAVHGDRRTAHSLHHCSHVSPLSRHQLPTHSSTTGLQREWCRLWLTLRAFPLYFHCSFPGRGDIAQLGERLHGMQEVGGSSPPISTNRPPGPPEGAFLPAFCSGVQLSDVSSFLASGSYFRGFPWPPLGSVTLRGIRRLPSFMKSHEMVSSCGPTSILRIRRWRIPCLCSFVRLLLW